MAEQDPAYDAAADRLLRAARLAQAARAEADGLLAEFRFCVRWRPSEADAAYARLSDAAGAYEDLLHDLGSMT